MLRSVFLNDSEETVVNFDTISVFSELTHIVSDVISDPTLPRTEDHPCPKCNSKEAVFFQAQTRRAEVSSCTYFTNRCTLCNTMYLRGYLKLQMRLYFPTDLDER